eukprot:1160088-Pelagomonas_calceolata.AAC.17
MQAIQYAWQLSTEVFELPPERIWVSVYEEDEEAYQLWLEGVGVPAERIKRMDGSSNFWASGATGETAASALKPCKECERADQVHGCVLQPQLLGAIGEAALSGLKPSKECERTDQALDGSSNLWASGAAGKAALSGL